MAFAGWIKNASILYKPENFDAQKKYPWSFNTMKHIKMDSTFLNQASSREIISLYVSNGIWYLD